MLADQALNWCLRHIPPTTVLDVGSGPQAHADIFRKAGWRVTTFDKHKGQRKADIIGDFHVKQIPQTFNLIWASHVLEHSPAPRIFLQRAMSLCATGGFIAITVPPAKHNIVGGHLSIWNKGLLAYNMIAAGLDLSGAAVGSYGYNISLITQKLLRPKLPLKDDNGDITLLSPYFPWPKFTENTNGATLPDMRWV